MPLLYKPHDLYQSVEKDGMSMLMPVTGNQNL
jgi:hypothetical protein